MLCGLLEKARLDGASRYIEKIPKTSYHVEVFANLDRPSGACSD